MIGHQPFYAASARHIAEEARLTDPQDVSNSSLDAHLRFINTRAISAGWTECLWVTWRLKVASILMHVSQ